MSVEKMREEFEAWAINDAKSCGTAINPARNGDWYFEEHSTYLNTAWAAWKASREAIEVEISGYDSLLRALYDGVDINDVFEAIKAQGLKVKVTP